MEKEILLEKLAHYKSLKDNMTEGALPENIAEKIDMLEKEIADLKQQQEDLRLQAKLEADKDLEKIDHYIELLEMLIAETLDDDIREDVDENESEIIEEKSDVEDVKEEIVEESVKEELRQEPSRFPSFNVR